MAVLDGFSTLIELLISNKNLISSYGYSVLLNLAAFILIVYSTMAFRKKATKFENGLEIRYEIPISKNNCKALSLSKLEEIIDQEFKELPEGHILFNVNKKMKVGDLEEAEAYIAKSLSKIQENVSNYCLTTETATEIKISPKMKVLLTGEDFEIKNLTENVQTVINGKVTTWRWSIKPQKSGIQKLLLTVYVIIEIPSYSDRDFCIITKKEDIKVRVNIIHTLNGHTDRTIAVLGLIVAIVTLVVTLGFKIV
jgi:hypothetical protein